MTYKTLKTCESYEVKIYLSGPIEVAKQIIRAFCQEKGLCVTITPTTYIYTGGEEAGYVVGLANYPRFPVCEDSLNITGEALAKRLLAETHQTSVMVVYGQDTAWYSRRVE